MNNYNESDKKNCDKIFKDLVSFTRDNEPIRRGCNSGGPCFCTGKCQEIVGWRKKSNLSLDDVIKKIKEITDSKEKSNTIKIAEPEGRGCNSPSHNPPRHRVYSSGTWQHTCPSCGNVTIFVVPDVWC